MSQATTATRVQNLDRASSRPRHGEPLSPFDRSQTSGAGNERERTVRFDMPRSARVGNLRRRCWPAGSLDVNMRLASEIGVLQDAVRRVRTPSAARFRRRCRICSGRIAQVSTGSLSVPGPRPRCASRFPRGGYSWCPRTLRRRSSPGRHRSPAACRSARCGPHS